MDDIFGSFRESIAVISIILAMVFISIFIWTKLLRREVLKIVGILVVLGVSLFANEPTSYFLAILVLATLVTNLEFLQNIAAIIRNSDAYFNHLVEKKSQKEIEASISNEIMEDNKAIEEDTSKDIEEIKDGHVSISFEKSNLSPMQFYLIAEEYTFKFLENKYGKIINRHVKINGTKQKVEFDGIITLGNKSSVVLEIKVSRKGYFPPRYIIDSIERTASYINQFSDQFHQNVELRYIFVGNISDKFKSRINNLKSGQDFKDNNIDVKFEFYSFEDIGLTDILNIEDK